MRAYVRVQCSAVYTVYIEMDGWMVDSPSSSSCTIARSESRPIIEQEEGEEGKRLSFVIDANLSVVVVVVVVVCSPPSLSS